jgi:hypothetical protein
MREWHQRPVSGEAETNDVISGGSDETVLMLRVGLCPCPSAGVLGELEMFRDSLWEASDEVERLTGTLTRLAGGPARRELARRSL